MGFDKNRQDTLDDLLINACGCAAEDLVSVALSKGAKSHIESDRAIRNAICSNNKFIFDALMESDDAVISDGAYSESALLRSHHYGNELNPEIQHHMLVTMLERQSPPRIVGKKNNDSYMSFWTDLLAYGNAESVDAVMSRYKLSSIIDQNGVLSIISKLTYLHAKSIGEKQLPQIARFLEALIPFNFDEEQEQKLLDNLFSCGLNEYAKDLISAGHIKTIPSSIVSLNSVQDFLNAESMNPEIMLSSYILKNYIDGLSPEHPELQQLSTESFDRFLMATERERTANNNSFGDRYLTEIALHLAKIEMVELAAHVIKVGFTDVAAGLRDLLTKGESYNINDDVVLQIIENLHCYQPHLCLPPIEHKNYYSGSEMLRMAVMSHMKSSPEKMAHCANIMRVVSADDFVSLALTIHPDRNNRYGEKVWRNRNVVRFLANNARKLDPTSLERLSEARYQFDYADKAPHLAARLLAKSDKTDDSKLGEALVSILYASEEEIIKAIPKAKTEKELSIMLDVIGMSPMDAISKVSMPSNLKTMALNLLAG